MKEARPQYRGSKNDMPGYQANGNESKQDMQNTPVANDIAEELLSPHGELHILQC